MKIYVGNLSREIAEDELRQAFEAFGNVISVNIVRGRESSESRGYGFVVMPSANEAQKAIEEMNGKDLKGLAVKVEEGQKGTPNGGGRGRQPGGGGNRRGGGFGQGDRGPGRY